MNTKKFNSKIGFILACVGSAIGMANVWGFPYRMANNGGGAFLITYIFFVILFSNLGLPAEYAIGRRSGTGTLGSYEYGFQHSMIKNKWIGKYIGWLPLAGSMAIAIGYAVIITYVFKGLVSSLTGELMQVPSEEWFQSIAFRPYSVVGYHIIVVLGALATIALGAKSIEKTNKIMMPLFFILFIILAIRVSMLPNAIEGYKFMFTPRWEKLLDPTTWIYASGQAFFSLSITGSGMIVYGAYLDKKEDIVSAARKTALFDTIAAIVSALVVIPACYAYHVDLASGPKLLFVVLPTILQDIPFGRLFAIILYTAVLFGGITSIQNMFEAVGESLLRKFKHLNRFFVLALIGAICLICGIGMETIDKWGPWMDWVSIYIIPIGAMIGAITWYYIMNKNELLDEINMGASHTYGKTWYAIGRKVYLPIVIALNLYAIIFRVAL